MLQLENLGKDFAGNILFKNISWHLRKGERVALIGENGAGKSTLMKIIAAIEEPSTGEIRLAKGAKAAYLPQDGIVTRGRSLFSEIRSAMAELLELEEQLQRLEAALTKLPATDAEHDKLLQLYGAQQERFRSLGGYTMEAEIGTVLKGLGFAQEDWHTDCGKFSGGWQMRIALARLLLQKPDLLLLDEPTNHLDIEARNWLEQYLCSYPGSVILVSHDRFFMDKVCSRIAEVWNHTITDYHCSYSLYLIQREERVTALKEAKKRQDEEIFKHEEFIRRFRYSASKAALVQSRVKQLEKIERITLPPERKKIHFQFPAAIKSGRIVLELKDLTRSYGNKMVLDKVNLTIESKERIALVGHNGAGKSTLMSVLAGGAFQGGQLIPGHNLVSNYFAQDQANTLDPGRTVYEELYADCPYEMVPLLRDILGAFLFSGDDIHKQVAVLSGGERNRLALAKMLLTPANLLLMDEPTNHLDLFSKEVLLAALQKFAGTVVFVSHDRYFVNSLATRVVEVADGNLTSFYGNYDDYLGKKEGDVLAACQGLPSKTTTTAQQPLQSVATSKEERIKEREDQKRIKREEQAKIRQQQQLEQQIMAIEQQLAILEEKMNLPGFFDDQEQSLSAGEQHASLTAELETLYQQWEILEI